MFTIDIDVGGTFTDGYMSDGVEARTAKVLTTPHDIAECITNCVEAGADILTVHAEACPHLHRVVQQIKEAGAKAGVALNPSTPLAALDEVLPSADVVMVMTVNPGFGGQTFIEEMLDKIRRLRETLDGRGLNAELEVDGGVHAGNIAEIARAGARVLVAGAAVFASELPVAEAVTQLRASLV